MTCSVSGTIHLFFCTIGRERKVTLLINTFEEVGKGQIVQGLVFQIQAVMLCSMEDQTCLVSQSGCHRGWIRGNPLGLQQNKQLILGTLSLPWDSYLFHYFSQENNLFLLGMHCNQSAILTIISQQLLTELLVMKSISHVICVYRSRMLANGCP